MNRRSVGVWLVLVLVALSAGAVAVRAQSQTLNVVDRLAQDPTEAPAENIRDTVQLEPGETLFLREEFLAGGGGPRDPARDAIRVTIQAVGNAVVEDQEIMTMYRVPGTTNLYTGQIATALRPDGINANELGGNGTLDVRGRSTITLVPENVGSVTVINNAAVAIAIEAEVDPVEARLSQPVTPATGELSEVRLGSRLFLRVLDDDANLLPGQADTVTLAVRDVALGGDSQNVVLTETGDDTGVFVGSLPTRFVPTTTTVVAGDGILQATQGSQIELAYVDDVPNTAGARTVTRLDRIPVRTITLANPTARFTRSLAGGAVTLDRIAPGQTAFLEVFDAESNLTTATDSITVTVVAQTAGGATQDTETFVLTETGNESGIFTAAVPTVFESASPTLSNGRLEVGGRHLLRATTRNNALGDRLVTTAPDLTVNFDGRVRLVQSAGTAFPGLLASINAGDLIFVEVVDDDLNTNSITDEVTVNVTSSAGDLVRLRLRKTSAGSSTFTIVENVSRADDITIGAIQNGIRPGLRTEVRAVAMDDGILQIAAGGTIGVEYVDANVVIGTDGAQRRSEQATVSSSSISSRDVRIRAIGPPAGAASGAAVTAPGQIVAGQPVCVEVDDVGADTSNSADPVNVIARVRSESGGAIVDQESIRAVETDVNTGVFVGCVNTNMGPRVTGDGVLTIQGNEIVELVYRSQRVDGTAVDLVTTLTAAGAYRQTRVASNLRSSTTILNLPNGARLTVPPSATYRPTTLAFELFFGAPGGTAAIDESGNPLPQPLNSNIKLCRVARRPFWYEIQPSGTAFRTPAELFIPIPPDLQVFSGADATSGFRVLSETERTRQLKIVFFDGFDWLPAGGRFVAFGGGPDAAQTYIQANVNHATTFALALDSRPPPLAGGPLITSVSLNNTTFTPNGDGANDTTTVNYALAEDSLVTIRIFDQSGEMIRTLVKDVATAAGFASQQWDGSYLFAARKAPAGLYVIEVKAVNGAATRRARETIMVGVVK